ncbi:MAG: DUF2500 domain-containing protein [Oscillospiraceae bacterium]|jgi:hypothetical protein|nr:DUF2500 domain-containing protein [Oscillospiraceae bacterium]
MPFLSSGFSITRLFPVFFLAILAVIVFFAVRGIAQWSKNNGSPRVPARARVVSRRENVDTHMHDTGDVYSAPMMTSSTTYYVTFEFDTGDRAEFAVSGREFGMLAEGDEGTLTFQGTRYIGFERE